MCVILPNVCDSAESMRKFRAFYSRLRVHVVCWSPSLYLIKLYLFFWRGVRVRGVICFLFHFSTSWNHTFYCSAESPCASKLTKWLHFNSHPGTVCMGTLKFCDLTNNWLLRMLKLLCFWIHNSVIKKCQPLDRGVWVWNPTLQLMSLIYDANFIKWHNTSFTVPDIKGLRIINLLNFKFSPLSVLCESETVASVHH